MRFAIRTLLHYSHHVLTRQGSCQNPNLYVEAIHVRYEHLRFVGIETTFDPILSVPARLSLFTSARHSRLLSTVPASTSIPLRPSFVLNSAEIRWTTL